ncbi:MAG: cell envelope integrity protein TolA [Chromatiales bacterium]|jgi:colicin import membrane protein|nr:cell envelope integrity protein TolA [Chromatiales bacterium]
MNLLRDTVAALVDGLKVLIEQPRALTYALLVHLGVLAVFVLSFEWTTVVRPEPPSSEPIVQAALVNEADVQREVQKLKEAEERKVADEAARQRRVEEQRKREEQQLADLKRQQEQVTKQAEEQRKRDEQAIKQAAEQRKQAEQAAQKAAEQRKQEEQRLADVKKQQDNARKAEQAKQAEQRKQEEQRLAEQKRRDDEAARQRAEEQRQRDAQAAETARRQQSEVDRYLGYIKQQVTRAWIQPPSWQKGQQCLVRVKLIPGGDVVAVSVVRSCGDAQANRSVEDAVWRAAPLQVPSADNALFDRFRELEFVFNPES